MSTTDAIRGIVCFKIGSCDHMIVCLKDTDYSIVEDYYDNCEEGDELVGEFKSYGYIEAYNLTKDRECRLYVEDWELTEDNAVAEWKQNCK